MHIGDDIIPYLELGLELLDKADACAGVRRNVDARQAELARVFRSRQEELILPSVAKTKLCDNTTLHVNITPRNFPGGRAATGQQNTPSTVYTSSMILRFFSGA